MSFFNIPATLDFSKILAQECERLAHQTGISLPQFKIYLPTRRAIRTLQEAFLTLSDGKPRLLPLMQPIGDADIEESYFTDGFEFDILPPIDGLRRQLILARLLEKSWPYEYNYQQALSIASDLGVLIDQIHTENLNIEDISKVVTESEFADYWNITADFLTTLLGMAWPEFLKSEGKIDAGLYRRLRIEKINSFYKNNSSKAPVIMAGSTGSIPATREFIKTIGTMDNGYVFLPALDKIMDDSTWLSVGEGHPQYLLKRLIDTCNVKRSQIPDVNGDIVNLSRLKLVSEMMRPSIKSDEWINLSIPNHKSAIQKGLAGVTLIEAETDHHEAMCISLSMLEIAADKTQTKTATLITPDRYLAMRVQENLKQWGIDIDDSGGTSLTNTVIGHFCLSILQSFNGNQINPTAFLSCLKSPMIGNIDVSTRTSVRSIEIELFRGVRPYGGFDILIAKSKKNKDFLMVLKLCFEPLIELQNGKHTIKDIVNAHILVLENLAKTNDKSGAQRLWVGEDGECLAQLLSNIIEQNDVLPAMNLFEYQEFLQSLLSRQTFTAKYGKHPRLSILGQIESRMIYSDRLILSGVNENIWPPDSGFDAWMSRKMRTDFHLPSLEQKTTLTAHDFSIGFCAPEVFITRSKKSGGQPTLPSRWLNRLETVLKAAEITDQDWPHAKGRMYSFWAMHTQHTQNIKSCDRPAPLPHLDRRPLSFSVTEIEKWMRDPYWIYAKKILGLKKLDSVDMDLSVADRGSIIHDTIDKFVKQHNRHVLPPDAYQKLIDIGEEVFSEYAENPEIHGLWWPRFTRAAKWFIGHENEWRINTDIIHSEIKGGINFDIEGHCFTLSGKADRIEKRVDDIIVLIDYKTGSPPQSGAVNSGVSSQLPLEALILNHNGFKAIESNDEYEYIFQYWSLSGSGDGGEAKIAQGIKGKDSNILIEEAYLGLQDLFSCFLNPQIPYLSCPDSRIMIEKKYNDYAHLERISEWSINSDDGEDL